MSFLGWRNPEEEAEDWSATLSFRAAIVAFEEGQHRDPVRIFRQRYLPEGLLEPSMGVVSRWVEQARLDAEAERKPPQNASQRIGLGDLAERMASRNSLSAIGKVPDLDQPGIPVFVPIEIVSHEPGDEGERFNFEVVALPHLAMGELFWLGLFLQDEYGWDPAAARGWVIADRAIPWTNAVEFETMKPVQPHPPSLHRHRIVINASIDFPVNRLAKLLGSFEDDEYRESPYPRIARPIDRAILEATLFAVERNDGQAWEDVLDLWNSSQSDRSWRYPRGREGARRFAKDVRRTYKTLLGKQLEWRRGPGKPRGDQE